MKECSSPANRNIRTYTHVHVCVCVCVYTNTWMELLSATTTTVVSSARSCYAEMIFWIFIPSRDTRSSRLLASGKRKVDLPAVRERFASTRRVKILQRDFWKVEVELNVCLVDTLQLSKREERFSCSHLYNYTVREISVEQPPPPQKKRVFFVSNCNIFSVFTIFKRNPGKTSKFITSQ